MQDGPGEGHSWVPAPRTLVFHAVGPRWHGGSHEEAALLASCYRRCLALAGEHQARSIAFPAISTGIYQFPRERAAEIAVGTVRSEVQATVERVVFCCFDDQTQRIYERLLGGWGD